MYASRYKLGTSCGGTPSKPPSEVHEFDNLYPWCSSQENTNNGSLRVSNMRNRQTSISRFDFRLFQFMSSTFQLDPLSCGGLRQFCALGNLSIDSENSPHLGWSGSMRIPKNRNGFSGCLEKLSSSKMKPFLVAASCASNLRPGAINRVTISKAIVLRLIISMELKIYDQTRVTLFFFKIESTAQGGVPPLKWSTIWDRFIPFSGGPRNGWKARQTRRDRAEAAAG